MGDLLGSIAEIIGTLTGMYIIFLILKWAHNKQKKEYEQIRKNRKKK